jgi:hypothetical protein
LIAYPIKNPAMPPEETEVNMKPISYAKAVSYFWNY